MSAHTALVFAALPATVHPIVWAVTGAIVEPATEQRGIGAAVRSYFREFATLRACPREFWVVQLVNLLDGVAYFSTLTLSTLYLSETLGYSDKAASNLWLTCMAAYTLTGFIAGFIGDSIGIRRTLLLSVGMLIVSRVILSFTIYKPIVIPSLFVIAIGTAIMTPILIAATKRYTTPSTQTAGFNLLYFLMNIGAFLGNFVFDWVRVLPPGNRSIFMMGTAMSILCWLSIIFFMRKRIAAADESREERKALEPAEKAWEPPWVIAWSVIRESAFWRFMLFLVILVGVRLVFEHQYAIYPKYYLRTIGENAPVGKLNSINPFIICFGVVLSTPIVTKFKLFNVMFVGITISAVSMLAMVIYPGWFTGPLGLTLSQGYYIISVTQIVIFSIGEVIWSPRLYEYTAAIAPPGREASYMGLSYVPMFFARLAEGPIAGELLTRYCPENITSRLGTVSYWQSPQYMCLLLAILALATPVLILVFKGVIQRESRIERDESLTKPV